MIGTLMAQDNIIINKTIIAPGSIVTGNSGIIIDGKATQQKKQKFTYQTFELPPIHRATIKVDGIALTVQNGSSLTLAKGLDYSIRYGHLLINDPSQKFFGSRIALASNTLSDIVVRGDCTVLLSKSLASLKIEGDSTITIQAPQEDIKLILKGDSTIHSDAHIKTLSIDFYGDIVIEAKALEGLSLNGSGDVILNIPKETKLTTKIEGDIVRRRDND